MTENIWSEIKKRNKKSNTKEDIGDGVEKKCLI